MRSDFSVSACTSDRNWAGRISTEKALARKAVMVEENYHEQEKLDKAKDLEREKLNKKKALEEIERRQLLEIEEEMQLAKEKMKLQEAELAQRNELQKSKLTLKRHKIKNEMLSVRIKEQNRRESKTG